MTEKTKSKSKKKTLLLIIVLLLIIAGIAGGALYYLKHKDNNKETNELKEKETIPDKTELDEEKAMNSPIEVDKKNLLYFSDIVEEPINQGVTYILEYDGNEYQELYSIPDFSASNFEIVDNKIYYLVYEQLKYMDIESGNTTSLFSLIDSNEAKNKQILDIITFNDKLYYVIDKDRDNRLYSISLSGQEKEEATLIEQAEEIELFKYDGNLYYTSYKDAKTTIYEIDSNQNKNTILKLSEDDHFLHQYNGKLVIDVFYEDAEDYTYKIYNIKTKEYETTLKGISKHAFYNNILAYTKNEKLYLYDIENKLVEEYYDFKNNVSGLYDELVTIYPNFDIILGITNYEEDGETIVDEKEIILSNKKVIDELPNIKMNMKDGTTKYYTTEGIKDQQ